MKRNARIVWESGMMMREGMCMCTCPALSCVCGRPWNQDGVCRGAAHAAPPFVFEREKGTRNMSEQITEQKMICLKNLVKTFSGRGDSVHAVQDVSLEIGGGEIYGIVGFSGAGKSTLVRCINLLERPTSGSVTVDGVELTALSGRQLNRERRKIGMIFQPFNLFATRTVIDNVAFPLKHTGLSRTPCRRGPITCCWTSASSGMRATWSSARSLRGGWAWARCPAPASSASRSITSSAFTSPNRRAP